MPTTRKKNAEAAKPTEAAKSQTILDVVVEGDPHWAPALEAYAHSCGDRDLSKACRIRAHEIRQKAGQRKGMPPPAE